MLDAGGQDVNERDATQRTALFLAAENGHGDAVRLLASRGADRTVRVKRAGRPLDAALSSLHWDAIGALIEAGVDFKRPDLIELALSQGQDQLLKLMLDRGLDPNYGHKDGSLILWAMQSASKKPACLDMLLAAGADVRAAEQREGPHGLLLAYPLMAKDRKLLQRLIDRGADVNRPIDEEGETPLMRACDPFFGDVKAIELLVKAGADLERTDHRGRTALNCCCTDGSNRKNPEAAKLLRKLGAREHAPEPEPVRPPDPPPPADPAAIGPVDKRRGTLKAWGYNDWRSTAIFAGDPARGIDGVLEKLAKMKKVGVVQRDVTAAALDGTLDAPDAPHLLLVKLKNHDWALAAASWIDTLSIDNLAEQLARDAGVRTVHCGHGDTASATYFALYEPGGKTAVAFESCGEGFTKPPRFEGDEPEEADVPQRWISQRYPESWWRQHGDENEALQALVRDQDAYLPFFVFTDEDSKLELETLPDDVLAPQNVERVALVVYGPASAARPNPAGQKLADAIDAGDASAVRAALAAGADLKFLPGGAGTPLARAVDRANHAGKNRLDVIRALLDARADPNDGGTDGPPVLAPFGLLAWESHAAIAVLDLLLAAGADINARSDDPMSTGSTALHLAARNGNLAMVQFLHARGADLRAPGADGLTPRQAAEKALAFMREHFGDVDGGDDGLDEVIDYLKRAESGAAPGKDYAARAAKEKAAAGRRRRKASKAFADLGAFVKQLGALTNADTTEDAEAAAANLATLGQPDKVKVRRDDEAKWQSPKARDAAVKALAAKGFNPVGTFTIDRFPDYRMRALLHPKANVYAAVCEMGGQRWVDLVRYHSDGSSLTVTNAPTAASAQVDLPKMRKIRKPRSSAARLVNLMLAQRPPKDVKVTRLTAAGFARKFEQHYATEMRLRKKATRKSKA
jgi:ankyrin repeat protein